MWCPKCGGRSEVAATRTADTVERFRKCLACGYAWQTIEAIKSDDYWREYALIAAENNLKPNKSARRERSLFGDEKNKDKK
jgi:transcriptional repressor NrdR